MFSRYQNAAFFMWYRGAGTLQAQSEAMCVFSAGVEECVGVEEQQSGVFAI